MSTTALTPDADPPLDQSAKPKAAPQADQDREKPAVTHRAEHGEDVVRRGEFRLLLSMQAVLLTLILAGGGFFYNQLTGLHVQLADIRVAVEQQRTDFSVALEQQQTEFQVALKEQHISILTEMRKMESAIRADIADLSERVTRIATRLDMVIDEDQPS